MKLTPVLAATLAFAALAPGPAAAQARYHASWSHARHHGWYGRGYGYGRHRGWYGHHDRRRSWGYRRHCRWGWRYGHRVRTCW